MVIIVLKFEWVVTILGDVYTYKINNKQYDMKTCTIWRCKFWNSEVFYIDRRCKRFWSFGMVLGSNRKKKFTDVIENGSCQFLQNNSCTNQQLIITIVLPVTRVRCNIEYMYDLKKTNNFYDYSTKISMF